VLLVKQQCAIGIRNIGPLLPEYLKQSWEMPARPKSVGLGIVNGEKPGKQPDCIVYSTGCLDTSRHLLLHISPLVLPILLLLDHPHSHFIPPFLSFLVYIRMLPFVLDF
jgi:hypothetical protein